MFMISGDRPAPRFAFSIGHGGLCRACDNIDGVKTPHSSTRILLGAEKMSPRAGAASVKSSRHIPTEEPLSLNTTAIQKRAAATAQHQRSKCASKRAPNRYNNPGFVKRRVRVGRRKRRSLPQRLRYSQVQNLPLLE